MRRHLRQFTICLVLGIITTVAVSWACAYLVQIDPLATPQWRRIDHESRNAWWDIAFQQTAGGARLVADGLRDLPPTDNAPSLSIRLFAPITTLEQLPRWLDDDYESQPPDPESRIWDWIVHDARGWPLLTMQSKSRILIQPLATPRVAVESTDGIYWMAADNQTSMNKAITTTPRSIPWHPRILPLRPIWPNFAYSVLSYAGMAWLLLIASREIRQLIRRQRGKCPRCGYDLRGGASGECSECGTIRA